MDKNKISVDSLVESKELREQYMGRTDVLDKVKSLMLLPRLECMTAQQVADYYEVDRNVINHQVARNRDELELDGMKKMSLSDARSTMRTSCHYRNVVQNRTKIVATLEDGTEVVIPNVGVLMFPKRAVLRMGMLLRDSKIAKEVRTQLLNIVEVTPDEKKVEMIDEETALLNGIGQAFGTGNGVEILQACMLLDTFRKRYITELEVHNKELSEANEQVRCENKILAKDILRWTDRASAARLIRVLAGYLHKSIGEAYAIVYKELLYKHHISLKARGGKPYIAHLKDDEWKLLYQTIAAVCEDNNINISEMFDKAKIDVSTLVLSD